MVIDWGQSTNLHDSVTLSVKWGNAVCSLQILGETQPHIKVFSEALTLHTYMVLFLNLCILAEGGRICETQKTLFAAISKPSLLTLASDHHARTMYTYLLSPYHVPGAVPATGRRHECMASTLRLPCPGLHTGVDELCQPESQLDSSEHRAWQLNSGKPTRRA